MEHHFTTFIRTKLLLQSRLKTAQPKQTTKVSLRELKKLHVYGYTLWKLRENNEIWYDSDGNFKPIHEGPLDFELIKLTKKIKTHKRPLSSLHFYMRNALLHVSYDTSNTNIPVYFKAFLQNRDKHLDLFFTVDGFSGRVHTPIVHLKGDLRQYLKLNDENVGSIDVKQMSPMVLAKLLEEHVGKNPFSDAVNEGHDIYNFLLSKNITLKDRDAGKKFFFQLVFGQAMDDIGYIFKGNTEWVEWINKIKTTHIPLNPHAKDTHTNLAWMLQTKEVLLMTEIWTALQQQQILFLSIHDEILVQKSQAENILNIVKNILMSQFKNPKLTTTFYTQNGIHNTTST